MKILAAVLLVFINGFFVAAEFSFVRIRRTRLEELANEDNDSARLLLKMLDSLDAYLSATQLGITTAALLLGWLGGNELAAVLWPLFNNELPFLPEWLRAPLAFTVSFGLIIFFQIVLGELAPRTLALRKVEAVALAVARPVYIFYYLLYPLVHFFHKAARAVVRVLAVGADDDQHTTEEVRMIVSGIEQAGVIDSMESRMIDNVLDFSGLLAREVMTPRQDVVCLYADRPFAGNLKTVRRSIYTRYPLCQGDKDRVVGMVHIRAVIDQLFLAPEKRDLLQVMKEVVSVPEGMPVSDVFRVMQKRHAQLAVVADEYGGMAGILTIEDIMEEIVGDLQDEYDQEEESVVTYPDGSFEFDGLMLLDDIEEILHTAFPEHEEDTMGGYVFGLLGRKPKAGDRVGSAGYMFEVKKVKGFRVQRIKVRQEAEAAHGRQ